MRGKKARMIRKQIYGDEYSPKVREYVGIKLGGKVPTIVNKGLRLMYQEAKRRIKGLRK